MTDLRRLTAEELVAWLGPWNPLSRSASSDLLRGAGVPWWIGGGWALEAAGMAARPHADVDIIVLGVDLPPLLDHLRAKGLHPWATTTGRCTRCRPEPPCRSVRTTSGCAAVVTSPGCSR